MDRVNHSALPSAIMFLVERQPSLFIQPERSNGGLPCYCDRLPDSEGPRKLLQ